MSNSPTKRMIAIIICLFFTGSSAVFGVYVANKVSAPLNPERNSEGIPIMGDPVGARINILILGLDKGSWRSDTIILASIDTKTNAVSVLSIPRDTRVFIDGHYDKINHVVGYKDRVESSIKAVKSITGIPINYYITVDPAAFRNVIDILGGVYLDVPQDMYYRDPAQNLYINLKKGYQLLDGDKAEQLVRYRYGYVDADLGRIRTQQLFIRELIKQKLTLSNIAKAREIFNELKKYVNTNYTVVDLVNHLDIAKKINPDGIEFFTLPCTDKMIDGISYVIYYENETRELIREKFSSLPTK